MMSIASVSISMTMTDMSTVSMMTSFSIGLSCHNTLHIHIQDHIQDRIHIQDHNLHNHNRHSIQVQQKHQPQLQQLARHLSYHSDDHDVHGFCNHRFCNHGFCNHVHDDQGRPGPHPQEGLSSPKVSCYHYGK